MVIAIRKYNENYISDDGSPSRLAVIKDMLAPKKRNIKREAYKVVSNWSTSGEISNQDFAVKNCLNARTLAISAINESVLVD